MADLKFRIYGETKPFKKALGSVQRDVQGFKAKLGSIGGIAAGVFGGGAALLGVQSLASTLGSVVAEAREAGRVGRLTNAVLKSTGGVANVSATQVASLAEAISNKTGIDDEQIQSAQNLLLTFTKVRNEVGKGNNVFDQASRLAVDMSVALGSDAKSAALQLGKALNDPIKGVTALTRAGVSFTAEQKKQIKAMVAAGDTLGAQKLILAEVGVQFGGAAAAAADPMQKLSVTVANLKERVGVALLPVLNKAATWLGEKLPGALDRLERLFSEKILPVLKQVTAWLKDKLGGALEGGKKIIDDLADAFGTNQATIVKALAAIGAALVLVAIAWNAGPGIIVTAVVALGAALLYAYNRFDWFRTGVQAVLKAVAVYIKVSIEVYKRAFQVLRTVVVAVWNAIKVAIDSVRPVLAFIGQVISTYVSTYIGVFNRLKDGIGTAIGFIKGLFNGIWDGLTAGLKVAVNGAIGYFEMLINAAVRGANILIRGINLVKPGDDIRSLSEVNLPRLATGGIVTGPTVALIGEAGPEAVVPLSRAGRAANIGMGGGTINVQVAVTVDPITGRHVYRLVQDDQRKNGPWNIKLSPSAA
jgi:hypothetical protein